MTHLYATDFFLKVRNIITWSEQNCLLIVQQSKTRQKNVAMLCIDQNSLWYGPTKLDSTLSKLCKIVQNSRKILKIDLQKLECWINTGRKNFIKVWKFKESYFEEMRFPTICNSHDVIYLHI